MDASRGRRPAGLILVSAASLNSKRPEKRCAQRLMWIEGPEKSRPIGRPTPPVVRPLGSIVLKLMMCGSRLLLCQVKVQDRRGSLDAINTSFDTTALFIRHAASHAIEGQ